MLRNHFKFALRIFLKDGAYSILNLLGLTLGISVGIILLLYLQNELSYDQHHEKKEQIYRFSNHLQAPPVDFNVCRNARELAPILMEEVPGVMNYVRFLDYDRTLVKVGEEEDARQFYEDRIFETDTSLLSVFSHQVIEGNPNTCLEGPGKVVLTESIAKKYFGNQSPMGEVLFFSRGGKRIVSAVISDLPDNSHLKYNILLSEISKRQWVEEAEEPMRKSEAFWNTGVYTYLLMSKEYNPQDIKEHFKVVFEKYFRPFADRIGGTATPRLEPLTDIHFQSKLENDEPQGNIAYVYTFAVVGFFIILLACINYMNLATARSVIRTEEIGMRKVMGDTRLHLFTSILFEAMILSFFAMILAVIISFVVLEFSPFNQWIDRALNMDFINNPVLTLGVIGLTLFVGLISGIYPAWYIPNVPIISALKGHNSSRQSGVLLRKVLIILQFTVSIFVVIATTLMSGQIDFLKNADLGFNVENVILIDAQEESTFSKMEIIKSEALKNPNVISAATAWGVPGGDLSSQVFLVEVEGEMKQQDISTIYAGKDYLNTIGFELLQGRNFRNDELPARSFIVNEALAKRLGWNENILEQRIRFFHGEQDVPIVGVIKDFHFQSLHNPITPLLILPSREQAGTLHIRVRGQGLEGTLDYLEEVVTSADPSRPFEYHFLDQEFEAQYRADQIQHQLISTLSRICIFISLLGLIGLSAFTIGQKAKEISIRKALGASVASILLLFSRSYVKLIIIALILSIPLAGYVIDDWMAGFAYQMPFTWYYYLLPGLIVVSMGLLTVVIQSLKSARANPVEGLRNE